MAVQGTNRHPGGSQRLHAASRRLPRRCHYSWMLLVLLTRVSAGSAVLLAAAAAAATASSASASASAGASRRPVDRHVPRWDTPATTKDGAVPVGPPHPPAGPYVGNGDVVAVYSASGTVPVHMPNHYGTALNGTQFLWLSKNDMWSSDQASMFSHLSAGKIALRGPAGDYNGSVQQRMGEAALWHTLRGSVAQITAKTAVLENNVVHTTVVCEAPAPCPLELTLSDTNRNHFRTTQTAGRALALAGGGSGSAVWWRKENLHDGQAINPAYLGSCDPFQLLQSTQRSFVVGGNSSSSNRLSMANGSCLWLADGANASDVLLSTGDCSQPQGCWEWRQHASAATDDRTGGGAAGDIVHCGDASAAHGQAAGATCLGAEVHGRGASFTLSADACGQRLWSLNSSSGPASGYLALRSSLSVGGPASSKCMVVVPDNTNNSLGVALAVANTATGEILKAQTLSVVNDSDPSYGMALSVTLAPGVNYSVLTALQTLRDIGCAGTTAETARCTQAPEEAAVALLESSAKNLSAIVAESQAFW
jgi:hypothetical protein